MSRYDKTSSSSPSPSSKSSPLSLIVGIAGIAGALIFGWLWNQEKSQAATDHEQAVKEISTLTNDLTQSRSTLEDTRRVVTQLAAKVETREGEITALSNKLAQTTTELTNTVEVLRDATNQLAKAWTDNKDFIEKAKTELNKRDQTIKEILDDRATERAKLELHILTLSTNLGQCDSRIAEVRNKLAESEKARAVLVAQNEQFRKLNIYWENIFNDPSALSSRTAKLRSELAEAHKHLDDSTNRTATVGKKFDLLTDGSVRLSPAAQK